MKNIEAKFRSDLELNQKTKIKDQIPFTCSITGKEFDDKTKVTKVTDVKSQKKKVVLGAKGSYFLEDFIPSSKKPLTFVCINIHVFQNSQGGNNFQQCDVSRIIQIVDWSNGIFFAFNNAPSDTVICNSHTIPQQKIDSRIRFVINRIEFYRDNVLNSQIYPNAHIAFANAMNQRDPNMRNQLNVFLTGASSTPYVNTLPSSNPNEDSYVTMSSTFNDSNRDFSASLTLAHELGHVFGLRHTYTGNCPPVTDEADNFYMFDIFGCGTDKIIPLIGGWSTEPFAADRDGIMNNIMGGSYKAGWLSTLQIAQMYYNIQNMHVKKYVNCCCKFSKCAFGAKIDRLKSAGSETLLEYTHTYVNYSWAFDGKYFTAPCDGLYMFSVFFQKDSLVDEGTPNDVWIHLMTSDDQILGTAWSEKSDQKTSWSPGVQQFGRRDSVGFSNIFDLKKGTMLRTIVKSDGDSFRNICDVNFSGHLIFNKNNY
ncbi:MAG TPA: M43 family zinc metalloprotease [Ignavibacteria bacterium]